MKNIKLVINNDLKKEKDKFFIKKELQCILDLYAKMVSNELGKIILFHLDLKKYHLMFIKERLTNQF